MKYFSLLFMMSFFLYEVRSQDGVGIGTDNVNDDAILEIESTTGGLLIPRMNTSQRNTLGASSAGLIVYDTNLQAFVYFDGSSWLRLVVQPAQVNLDMSNHKIINLSNGTNGKDAVNKSQMDAADNLQVTRSGDSMTGTLNMGGNRITSVANGVLSTDVTNKSQLDQKVTNSTQVITKVDFTAGTGWGVDTSTRAIKHENGMVQLVFRGLRQGASTNSENVMATLPSGWRPASSMYGIAGVEGAFYHPDSDGKSLVWECSISTNGKITIPIMWTVPDQIYINITYFTN